MSKQKKKKVVIVEDHPIFLERVAQLINNEPDLEMVGEADSAEAGLVLIKEAKPDLAVVDLTLQGSSGLAMIKSLRALGVEVPVLVLSMHEETLYAERAIRAGAAGYITKHRAANEVIRAIRKVLAGEIYLSESVTAEVVRGLSGHARNAPTRSLSRLTDRELEVLRLIGRGRTTREIAELLKLGVASIDTYRARIKEKMNLRNAIELQNFAIRWVTDGE